MVAVWSWDRTVGSFGARPEFIGDNLQWAHDEGWRPVWPGRSCGQDLALGADLRWVRQLVDGLVLQRLVLQRLVLQRLGRARLGPTPGTRFVVVTERDVVVFKVVRALGADEFAGQTRCYARAVGAALGKPCLAVRAHQPVVGLSLRSG